MKTFRMKTDRTDQESPGTEAVRWLLQLKEDEQGHREGFLEWLSRSPRHVEVFLETFEMDRLLGGMQSARAFDVEAMLRDLHRDVIALPNVIPQLLRSSMRGGQRNSAAGTFRSTTQRISRSATMVAAAAAVAALAGGAWLWSSTAGPRIYETVVGEQRICKLDDGSIVYLNTDSRIKVAFSDGGRSVWLERGEALFSVERGAARPFVVSTADAHIRVLGTQFNVRRRSSSTDVAVLDGAVQVMPVSAAASAVSAAVAAPLRSGEEARISAREATRKVNSNVQSVLAWQSRRLTFTEAPLEEVAAEFNRYNESKIRVEGTAGTSKRLTGIFDADRPQALMLYAAKSAEFVVEPEGNDWVIRGR